MHSGSHKGGIELGGQRSSLVNIYSTSGKTKDDGSSSTERIVKRKESMGIRAQSDIDAETR